MYIFTDETESIYKWYRSMLFQQSHFIYWNFFQKSQIDFWREKIKIGWFSIIQARVTTRQLKIGFECMDQLSVYCGHTKFQRNLEKEKKNH